MAYEQILEIQREKLADLQTERANTKQRLDAEQAQIESLIAHYSSPKMQDPARRAPLAALSEPAHGKQPTECADAALASQMLACYAGTAADNSPAGQLAAQILQAHRASQ